MARPRALTLPRVIAAVVVLGIAAFSQYSDDPQDPAGLGRGDRAGERSRARASADASVWTIARAHAEKRSDIIVEARGEVIKTLADDNDGSRHQRFLVRLPDRHTVLIAHNIDLAPRVPVEPGDTLDFKGEYEWNDRGGVVHWTHHDPAGRHPGGWIEADGLRYE